MESSRSLRGKCAEMVDSIARALESGEGIRRRRPFAMGMIFQASLTAGNAIGAALKTRAVDLSRRLEADIPTIPTHPKYFQMR